MQEISSYLLFCLLQDVGVMSESSSDSESNSSSSSSSDSDSDSDGEQETAAKKANGHGKFVSRGDVRFEWHVMR